MYLQRVLVTYLDGTTKEVACTQWALGQFAQYANRQGWKVDIQNPGLMSLPMLRFQAFAELHRDVNAPKVAFDKWDLTVSDVSPVEEENTPDPTQQDPSAD